MSSRPIRLHSHWFKIKSEMRVVDTFWNVCRALGSIPRNTHTHTSHKGELRHLVVTGQGDRIPQGTILNDLSTFSFSSFASRASKQRTDLFTQHSPEGPVSDTQSSSSCSELHSIPKGYMFKEFVYDCLPTSIYVYRVSAMPAEARRWR